MKLYHWLKEIAEIKGEIIDLKDRKKEEVEEIV
jgi:hypothetical protein